LAATISAAIIIAAFAARTTSREGRVQQRTGFQCPADSWRQCGGAAVGICVAGVILLADRRWWRWRWRAGGAAATVLAMRQQNKQRQQQQHDNNTTTNTTTNKTANTEGE
jgi:hypothetical protein